MSDIVYNVFLDRSDPDDPEHFEFYGARKTLAGAQALAEKALKRRIYGYYKRGDSMGKPILETGKSRPDERQARIVYDWQYSSKGRDMDRSDLHKALRKDQKDLARNVAALKRLRRGEHVPNLTEAGARSNIQGLRATIANKRRLLSKGRDMRRSKASRRDVRSWYARQKARALHAHGRAKHHYGTAKTHYGTTKTHAQRHYQTARQHAATAHAKAKAGSAKAKEHYELLKRRAAVAKKHASAMRAELRETRDPRRPAATIPKNKRVAAAREIRALVKRGYNPTVAAHKVYAKYGRDPGSKITAAQRGKLHPWQYALPKREALPLSKDPRTTYQPNYVRASASRLASMHHRGTITENEYRTAHSRIRHAERQLGIHPRRRPRRK